MPENSTAPAGDVIAAQQAGIPAGFNLSLLDPNSYEEPKELVPVEVIKSAFRWSAEEYNKGSEFRAAFPQRGTAGGPLGNSIQQWDLQLKRLDAVFYHEDGSHFFGQEGTDQGAEIPVIMYAGVDLEKMDKKTSIVHPLAKTRGKEPMVVNAWTKLVGALIPNPEKIEGTFLQVESFREKEMGGGFFAKNVVLPIEILPPTFTFTGEMQRFKAKVRVEGDTADGDVQGGGSAPTAGGDVKAAAEAIIEFLSANSLTAESVDVAVLGHPNFPAASRIEPFTTACATGELAKALAEATA